LSQNAWRGAPPRRPAALRQGRHADVGEDLAARIVDTGAARACCSSSASSWVRRMSDDGRPASACATVSPGRASSRRDVRGELRQTSGLVGNGGVERGVRGSRATAVEAALRAQARHGIQPRWRSERGDQQQAFIGMFRGSLPNSRRAAA
jgi:hypothetical protein